MTNLTPTPFVPDWPEVDPRYLREERQAAPIFPVHELFPQELVNFCVRAAAAKGAPVDYVAMGLLVIASSLLGNARWVRPWDGWTEPPVLWAAMIGTPSMGKSPGLDASLSVLQRIEAKLRTTVQTEVFEWERQAEIAKFREQAWKEEAKTAAKAGDTIKSKPDDAEPGPKPEPPRLKVSDATIEKLAMILERQPKGVLLVRDELAGWLMGMSRYAGGGSDRPFWLEAYGGRPYTVERLGRPSVDVARLAIPVVGNIQPDRLRTLFLKADDDGLLARIMPVWPAPAPLSRPQQAFDDCVLEPILERLLSLEGTRDSAGVSQPTFLEFTEEAREALHAFRQTIRGLEADKEGLLLSFLGKLPGLTVRIALVVTYLQWVCGHSPEPAAISGSTVHTAVGFVESYVLPMAERSYGTASVSKNERAGRRLLELIRNKGWSKFTSREVRRMERSGLSNQEEIDMGIAALEQADVVRKVDSPVAPKGGRPTRLYAVNPQIHMEDRIKQE